MALPVKLPGEVGTIIVGRAPVVCDWLALSLVGLKFAGSMVVGGPRSREVEEEHCQRAKHEGKDELEEEKSQKTHAPRTY